MIPSRHTRSHRACGDEEHCMFFSFSSELCNLPACRFYRSMDERNGAPCQYHMSIHEYATLVDDGLMP